MLFSHCFLKCFLFSGGIFLKVRSGLLLELFIQPYAAHKGMTTYIQWNLYKADIIRATIWLGLGLGIFVINDR